MAHRRRAVPAGHRVALCVHSLRSSRPSQHRVPALDVAEVAQDGLGGRRLAVGAVVPLQVADPQH